MTTPKVITAIVCEDTRIEKNGKHIIIGVYPSDIVLAEIPTQFPIMFWLQIDEVGQEQKSFEFRMSMAGKEIATGGFTVATKSIANIATIPVGQFMLSVEKEGDLKFDVRLAPSGRWKNAIAMPVRLRPSSTA